MEEIPRYMHPTFATNAVCDESFEIERIRESFSIGTRSSFTRLDRLPNTIKSGAIDAKKQCESEKNLEMHFNKNFFVRNVSRFEGFSTLKYIMDGDINKSKSITKQLKTASAPFRPTSNQFQKGKYKDLLGNDSYHSSTSHIKERPPDPYKAVKLADILRKPTTPITAKHKLNNKRNLKVNTESLTIPKIAEVISPKLVKSTSESDAQLFSGRGRPDVSNRDSFYSNAITRKIFNRYHLKSAPSSTDKQQSPIRDQKITGLYDKSTWINDAYFVKVLNQWSDRLLARLVEDWYHTTFTLDFSSLNVILIQFDITNEKLPIKTIINYMNFLATHGLASELGLGKKTDRWGVIENVSFQDEGRENISISGSSGGSHTSNQHGEYERKEAITFAFIPPWNADSVLQASRAASREQRNRARETNTSLKELYGL